MRTVSNLLIVFLATFNIYGFLVYEGSATYNIVVNSNQSEIDCMIKNMYYEAATQPERGILAVGYTVVNRVKDERWPSDVCGVIYQKDQFSWTSGNTLKPISSKQYNRLKPLAKLVLSTPSPITSTHYHAVYVKPYWSTSMRKLHKIGDHIFYEG